MDFALTPEQAMIRDSARKLAEAELAPRAARADREGLFPLEQMKALADAGFLAMLVPQAHGVIVNISSVHEEIAWSGYSAYTASKAGLGMMTKTLAQEAAPHGVRVLSVAPGAIKTPINQTVWSDPASLHDLLEKIPLNRLGEPDDIARMVVVLVSDAASYMTGRTVFVDGGMTDYPDFAHGG